MGSGHALRRTDHASRGIGIVDRLAAEPKIVGTLAFAAAVAATPSPAWPVFAVDAALVAVVVMAARLPVGEFVLRLAAVLPFLSLAVLVPLVGTGEQIDVLGVSMSKEGLWSAFGIAAKALLGGSASVVLTMTTPIPRLLAGLGRLRVPAVVVGIAAFMLRYLDLLADQLGRMRTAMVARCHDPRWLWQAKPIASAAGTMFVRTYERGERVHQAMLARGYNGALPDRLGAAARGPLAAASAALPGVLALAALLWWHLG